MSRARALLGSGDYKHWIVEAASRVCSGTAFLLVNPRQLMFSDAVFILMRLALSGRYGDLRQSSNDWAGIGEDYFVRQMLPVFAHVLQELSTKQPEGSGFDEISFGESAVATKTREYDETAELLTGFLNPFEARVYSLAQVLSSQPGSGDSIVIPINDDSAVALLMHRSSLGRAVDELLYRGLLEIVDARHSRSRGIARRLRLKVSVSEYLSDHATGRPETGN